MLIILVSKSLLWLVGRLRLIIRILCNLLLLLIWQNLILRSTINWSVLNRSWLGFSLSFILLTLCLLLFYRYSLCLLRLLLLHSPHWSNWSPHLSRSSWRNWPKSTANRSNHARSSASWSYCLTRSSSTSWPSWHTTLLGGSTNLSLA